MRSFGCRQVPAGYDHEAASVWANPPSPVPEEEEGEERPSWLHASVVFCFFSVFMLLAGHVCVFGLSLTIVHTGKRKSKGAAPGKSKKAKLEEPMNEPLEEPEEEPKG